MHHCNLHLAPGARASISPSKGQLEVEGLKLKLPGRTRTSFYPSLELTLSCLLLFFALLQLQLALCQLASREWRSSWGKRRASVVSVHLKGKAIGVPAVLLFSRSTLQPSKLNTYTERDCTRCQCLALPVCLLARLKEMKEMHTFGGSTTRTNHCPISSSLMEKAKCVFSTYSLYSFSWKASLKTHSCWLDTQLLVFSLGFSVIWLLLNLDHISLSVKGHKTQQDLHMWRAPLMRANRQTDVLLWLFFFISCCYSLFSFTILQFTLYLFNELSLHQSERSQFVHPG